MAHMRGFLAGILLSAVTLAVAWAQSALPAAPEAGAPAPPADMPAHVMADMPEPLVLILFLGGLVASLILIRGAALRRAAQSVSRLPGDAPRS